MTLAKRIFDLSSFQRQYKSIVIRSCVSTLVKLYSIEDNTELDWNNVLSCASILSLSDAFEHQAAALRIAQYCLQTNTTQAKQKVAASVLLDNLTNRPAINLAIKRNYLDKEYFEQIPLPLAFDITKRKISHTILTNTREIYLNKFQKEAYERFRSADMVSVSAPTSAGKSFVLYQTLIKIVNESSNLLRIVYIVPTRALINQVEKDFRAVSINENADNIFISSVPRLEEGELSKNIIFVFTQERLHWFKVENPSFGFDYIIVDEAQKIGEGNRGILLQEKIEELIATMPKAKIFYSSPLTSNPEILLSDGDSNKQKEVVKTEYVAVNQNLIHVSQTSGNTKKWNVELCLEEEKINLGHIYLENRPTSELKRIAFIVYSLSYGEGGSIIYMNKAAFAEKLSNVLYDVVAEDASNIEEIKQLIEFVQKTVHKDYLLCKVLSKGIAFHYGNMPILIRQEIERLFDKGIIKYLICTSTLLEGVNLPAKSIFMRKPVRGSGNPLKNADFWNLAGRAGRLGKEFQGNIICIDPNSWEFLPSISSKKQEIKKAIDKISDNSEELLSFISNKTPRSVAKSKPELEYAFTYYFSNYLKDNTPESIRSNPNLIEKLKSEFDTVKSEIEIPNEIIFRHPGVSPIAQQALLNHFREKEAEIENYIPALPESEKAVENSYVIVVGMISRFFSGDTELLNYYYAMLVVNWMRGYPLSLLIKNNFEYAQKKQRKKLDAVIRDTMRDVEEYARFKFAKFSACYIDILRYYFNISGHSNLSSEIPDMHIWLEFGVSQTTQISLISLGLSRQSAITISEFIAKDNMTKEECRKWISNNDLNSLQISQIVLNEVSSLFIEEIKS